MNIYVSVHTCYIHKFKIYFKQVDGVHLFSKIKGTISSNNQSSLGLYHACFQSLSQAFIDWTSNLSSSPFHKYVQSLRIEIN